MGHGSRALLAGSLGFTVAFVVACGSSNGLLTANQASNLNGQLNSISSAVAAQQCGAATSAAGAFSNEVAGLPNSVNTTLVRNLGQGADTVSQLAARDCSSTSSTSSSHSTTTTTTTTTSSPTTTTTTSTPTTTNTNSSTSTTATNPSSSGTTTTSNGGAGIATTTNGGAGAGGNNNG